MKPIYNRRDFMKTSAVLATGVGLTALGCQPAAEDAAPAPATTSEDPLFKISLAQWSVNRKIFGGKLQQLGWEEVGRRLQEDYQSLLNPDYTTLDFPKTARELGIDGVEYVNTCLFDKARDTAYLQELKNVCAGEGVTSVLIMCDAEGELGNPDEAARMQAVENHHKWVEAAAFLGCHSIRVNAQSSGSYEEQQRLAADGLRRLCEYGDQHNINVIVENHGGLSSNGQWLAGVMEMVDHPRVGTLPDFGNFLITPYGQQPEEWYDRYQGVTELMPYAKSVSAKTQSFDADGNEERTDYYRMMKVVLDAGYRGWVGIEYEGAIDEMEGIKATHALLDRVRAELSEQYT